MYPSYSFFRGLENCLGFLGQMGSSEGHLEHQYGCRLYQEMQDTPPWPNTVQADSVRFVGNESQQFLGRFDADGGSIAIEVVRSGGLVLQPLLAVELTQAGSVD